jgi:hypothetical protein
MKKVFLLSVLMLALAAGNAAAAIGWGGNVWPNSSAIVVPTGPVNVYAQCWKGGVTDAGGQGAGIEAFCDMSADGGAVTTVQMTFQGDVGSNDEYTTQVPQGMLMGASYVEVHVKFHDLTDDTWYTDVKDQANNSPPQRYNVTNVLPVDVNVTFKLCMSGEPTSGAPCVIGSAPEIGSWGSGVMMTSLGGDLYEVVVTFLAGHNPYFEYKFKKDGCSNWEGASNRIVTLPTDGTTSVVLGICRCASTASTTPAASAPSARCPSSRTGAPACRPSRSARACTRPASSSPPGWRSRWWSSTSSRRTTAARGRAWATAASSSTTPCPPSRR